MSSFTRVGGWPTSGPASTFLLLIRPISGTGFFRGAAAGITAVPICSLTTSSRARARVEPLVKPLIRINGLSSRPRTRGGRINEAKWPN